MIAGSTPAVAKLTSRPSGSSPRAAARSPVITSSAAAPSLIWLELPAVTVPPVAKTGRRAAILAASESWRIPSSASNETSPAEGRPSASTSVMRAATGVISSRNRPSRCAAEARWWERRPHASWSSRLTPNCSDTFSAVSPIERYTCGRVSARSGSGVNRWPIMGTKLMDSIPPAITTSWTPAWTDWVASASACSPEAQKRLMVMALALIGSPAPRATCRAMFSPWAPSGMAQPRTRSSTSAGSKPGARSRAARMAATASSSGGVSRSVPRGALPTAVRAAETMTASRMNRSSSSCGVACRS